MVAAAVRPVAAVVVVAAADGSLSPIPDSCWSETEIYPPLEDLDLSGTPDRFWIDDL